MSSIFRRAIRCWFVLCTSWSGPASAQNAETIDPDFSLKKGGEAGLRWHFVSEKPFRLSGFCYYENDRLFRRLPAKPTLRLPGSVDNLAWHTSGGQVTFRTDSDRISIRVKLRPGNPMRNVSRTAQASFDLLRGEPSRKRFAGLAIPGFDEVEFQREVWSVPFKKMAEYTLNFPLYQGVETVEIGLAEGAKIEPPSAWRQAGPVVVYGGSTLQGASASRPGNSWTMMLSLRLNMEFANMGFSGSGRTEASVAEALAAIKNPALYMMCSDTNSTIEQLRERFVAFIRILRREHPQTPILVMTRPMWGGDRRAKEVQAAQGLETEQAIKVAFLKSQVELLQKKGDAKIFFQDGSEDNAEDFDLESVDGSHMNDLGFYRIAERLEPLLRKLLELP